MLLVELIVLLDAVMDAELLVLLDVVIATELLVLLVLLEELVELLDTVHAEVFGGVAGA